MLHTVLDCALVTLVALAAAFDLKTRRIPNALTVTGLLLGLALRAFLGWSALGAGLLGALIALTLTTPLVLLGGLGGGDAKLLAAVGGYLGMSALPTALLATALAGGVMAFGTVLLRGALVETLAHCRVLVGNLVRNTVASVPSRPLRTLDTPGSIAIPYGVAIAIGALAGVLV